MGAISDIHNPWRDGLMPASFRGVLFHVETGSRESGRRIVTHEFPKKDEPYSEDMGRRAVEFTVRGYCIAYPYDVAAAGTGDLYRRDYRVARDALIRALERRGYGGLQLPTFPGSDDVSGPMWVVCSRYRVTEEERFGGYAVFDMQFVEFGFPPGAPGPVPRDGLIAYSHALRNQVIGDMNQDRESLQARATQLARGFRPRGPGAPAG